MPLPLEHPAQFDRMAYDDLALHIPGDSPLEIVRAAQMTFLRAEPEAMIAAMRRLDGVAAVPADGIRLLIRYSLGDEALVAQEEVQAFGTTPLELENVVHTASAIGISSAVVGELERAQSHLLLARTLAQALGLTNRWQTLTMEWSRVAGLRGNPQPEALEELLRQPMPARRRAWGQRTLSEAYMSLGDYQSALRVLGTPDGDTPADAAQRDFIHALMGYPAVSEVDPTEDYARLAAALRMAARGQYTYDLAGITSEPEQCYAAVLEGTALAMTDGLAQQAVRVLGRHPYPMADLAFYRLVVLMAAVASGATLYGGAFAGRETPMLEQMTVVLGQMRAPEQAVEVLRRLSTREFVLLLFSPVGEALRGLGLTGIPLLVGKHLLNGDEMVPMPGAVGSKLVLSAMGLPTNDIERWERPRLREIIEKTAGQIVNMGFIARSYLRLAENAARLGHLNEAAAWRGSYVEVARTLSPEVQAVVRKYPPAP